MQKRVTLLSILFFCCVQAQVIAQRPGGASGRAGGQQPTGRFYGKVVDAANKGIDAATVTLVQQRMDTVTKQRKEVIVGGMLTGANGEFSIENVPAFGHYTLRITGIGYKTVQQPVAFLSGPRNGAANNPSAMLDSLD